MKLVCLCLCLIFVFPILPANAGQLDVIDYELLPYLQDNPQALMLFASELNISNGNPYTRDYGERGMFDKLESAESIFNRWDEYDAETVYTEVYRLLFGPFKNDGCTEYSYAKVGKGKVLDYATGKWIKTEGGTAIRIRHTTEYYGKIRYRYLLLNDSGEPAMIYTHLIK